MNLRDSSTLVHFLRSHLEPVERAEFLIDTLEGVGPDARRSAVLMALFDQNSETYLAFIRRASTLRSHSGQIAFPGGGYDVSDSSLAATALREAYEEIDLDPARVQLLGVLPPVFTVVSNYLITPVVAYLPQGPGDLHPSLAEVAEVILIPLAGLADPAIVHTEEWMRDGLSHTVHFYDYGPYRIWGATARIVYTFLRLLATAP